MKMIGIWIGEFASLLLQHHLLWGAISLYKTFEHYVVTVSPFSVESQPPMLTLRYRLYRAPFIWDEI